MPVAIDSTLPTLLENPNETISSLEIIASDIGKIIKALKVNKAHGHDEFSIMMFKLCESAITEPVHLVFNPLMPGGNKKVTHGQFLDHYFFGLY